MPSLLPGMVVEYASEWTSESHEIIVGAVNDGYDARRIASASKPPRRKAS